jgi:energy-coupling factor transporter ATP-binding protein EcfA2
MTKSINPNYNFHQISVPFRGLLIGSSGAGKTNLLMNIIVAMPKTFNHIYIYSKATEPLYDFLTSQLSSDLLTISYDLDDLRNFDDKNYYGQTLLVVDDMCLEKNQECISELYIRGRKICGGVSLLYLSQSYFKIPKTIRLQSDYIFILKVGAVRDLKMILSEYSLQATKQQLTNMYNYCCNSSQFGEFFLTDLKNTQDKTYRKNFTEFLNITDF